MIDFADLPSLAAEIIMQTLRAGLDESEAAIFLIQVSEMLAEMSTGKTGIDMEDSLIHALDVAIREYRKRVPKPEEEQDAGLVNKFIHDTPKRVQ